MNDSACLYSITLWILFVTQDLLSYIQCIASLNVDAMFCNLPLDKCARLSGSVVSWRYFLFFFAEKETEPLIVITTLTLENIFPSKGLNYVYAFGIVYKHPTVLNGPQSFEII